MIGTSVAVRRLLKSVIPLALAAVVLAGLAGPAAAYTIVSETGMIGSWSLTDTAATPGATCRYGAVQPPNHTYLRWVKVRPPVVYAADRSAEKIDRKKIVWFWRLQRKSLNGTTWHTVGTSTRQSAFAYENQPAPFSASTIYENGSTNAFSFYRALVVIRWVKANGTIEGAAKATVDYYRLKSPFGIRTSGGQFCGSLETSG